MNERCKKNRRVSTLLLIPYSSKVILGFHVEWFNHENKGGVYLPLFIVFRLSTRA
jgi:hypothetical protein